MCDKELDLRNELEEILKGAGSIIMSYFGTELSSREKEQGSPVTQADLDSESYLIENLSKLVPNASFFAEESGKSGNNDYCWVIDPLDGTTNFIHQLPYFCISVALTHKGEPKIGAIYEPMRDHFYYAKKGDGAFLNGNKISVSSASTLQKTRVLIGSHHSCQDLINKIGLLGPQHYSFRYMGAAALDCAYVASGRLDAVIFSGLSWWDVSAGIVLIQEAGGIITDFEGNPLTENYESCVGGNAELHRELREFLVKS